MIPGSERSPAEGNDNPLQYSCLGNSMDRGAWRAAVYGVAKSRTPLSDSHTGRTKILGERLKTVMSPFIVVLMTVADAESSECVRCCAFPFNFQVIGTEFFVDGHRLAIFSIHPTVVLILNFFSRVPFLFLELKAGFALAWLRLLRSALQRRGTSHRPHHHCPPCPKAYL